VRAEQPEEEPETIRGCQILRVVFGFRVEGEEQPETIRGGQILRVAFGFSSQFKNNNFAETEAVPRRVRI